MKKVQSLNLYLQTSALGIVGKQFSLLEHQNTQTIRLGVFINELLVMHVLFQNYLEKKSTLATLAHERTHIEN